METETEIPYNKNIEDKKLFLFFGCVWLNISTGQTAPATVKIKEIELLGSDQFIHHYLLLLLFLERERVMIISQSCLTPFQILSSTLWVRNCPLFWDASSFLKIKDCHSSRVCFAVVVVSTTSSWDDKDGAERRTCFFFRFSDGRTCHQEQHNFSIILKRLNFYSFLLRTDCTRVLVSPKDNHRRAKQQPHPYTQRIYSSITFFLQWLTRLIILTRHFRVSLTAREVFLHRKNIFSGQF